LNRISIVGASGYVGRHLTAALARQGVEVNALSSRDGTGIDPRTGLLPPDLKLPEGTEAVVYAAQSPHYREVPAMAWHLQAVGSVAATQAALAAQRAGARRFIYLSTGNVYQPSFEPLAEDAPVSGSQWYPLSKLQGEQSLAMLRPALDVTVVRVFAIYGPDQDDKLVPKLAASVDQGRTVTVAYRREGVADSGLRFNPCHVDDAVAVLSQLALQGGPEVINLAGPDVVGVADLARTWARLRGVEAHLAAAPGVRPFDLVGDTTRLTRWTRHRFIGIDEGLARIAHATPRPGS
jgi:nucleoside-diphosphate-sugar epimerase